jgi:hypothetical protein
MFVGQYTCSSLLETQSNTDDNTINCCSHYYLRTSQTMQNGVISFAIYCTIFSNATHYSPSNRGIRTPGYSLVTNVGVDSLMIAMDQLPTAI